MAKQIEQYELTERIKQVNGASWWRGWDSKLERDVSVWSIPITDARLEQLKQSAAAAANLHDPRILRVLDVVWNDEIFAVVSEWAHGVTISERVLGRAPLKNAQEIMQSLVQCISQAHNQGIFHNALTADEVVLTASGIKVRGFGIAGVLSGNSITKAKQADLAALGAIGYAAVTGTWPLPTTCNLPPAPISGGVVALPSQVTAKLPNYWDEFVSHSLPTISASADQVSISELSKYLQEQPKAKAKDSYVFDLPPTKLTKRGVLGALAGIAVLFVAGYFLVFASLSSEIQSNPVADVETGTDLRNEELPMAAMLILTDGESKAISGKRPFTITNGQALQIQLKERRTVQRVELDLSVGGANLFAQVSDNAITIKSDLGKLGEVSEAPTTAIIFGPRFITGNYVTIWFELTNGDSVQINRVAAYGTPS